MNVLTVDISLGIQFIFCIASLIGSEFTILQIPWFVWTVAFAPIFIILPIQELTKLHDKTEWERFQKRSKLEFNTKLGMHSPL